MRYRITVLCCALLCLIATASIAATISYTDSVPLAKTNWTSSITVQKFDPSLGTLTGITFMLTGYVEGSAKFESLDAAPAVVSMNLSARVSLQRPDLSDLVVSVPVVSTSDAVPAFDGLADFGGTSGKTYPGLTASRIEQSSAVLPSDLTLFTASFAGENIVLPVAASGNSEGSGAGNLLVVFQTFASAAATVTYEYEPVPEPSSLMALLMGIGGIAGLSSRKRQP
mgnify:CR=1 FL=1